MDVSGFVRPNIGVKELNDIKKCTPEKYYLMSATERFIVHINIANLAYMGLLNGHEELRRLSFNETTYKWRAKKCGEELLFKTREDIRKHFDLKVAYQGESKGYMFEKINLKRVTDLEGNILADIYGKTY